VRRLAIVLNELAPRARFELATLRLTAEMVKTQNAPFGVAYRKMGTILPSSVAPNAAPKTNFRGLILGMMQKRGTAQRFEPRMILCAELRDIRTIHRIAIHRQSFRASVLHLSELRAVLKSDTAINRLLTTPPLLSTAFLQCSSLLKSAIFHKQISSDTECSYAEKNLHQNYYLISVGPLPLSHSQP
jgi:hypothetical protein